MIDRILAMIRPGRVTLVDDRGAIRKVQVDEGDFPGGRRVVDGATQIELFGHAGVPPIGSEAVLASPGGDRSQTLVVGVNHQSSRPRGLKPGDTVLYDVRGAKVQLTAVGLLIDCAGLPAVIRDATKVTIDAADVFLTGNLHIAGNATVQGELDVTGKIAGGGLISAGGDVEAGGGALSLERHRHGGVKAGSDRSDLASAP